MKEGDVLLTSLPQADGTVKDRPVLFLCRMPPFDDFLVCGITSQLQQAAPEIDEQITPGEPDYRTSGRKAAWLILLGFLAVLPRSRFKGRIGSISRDRRLRLLTRLSDFLRSKSS
jgi:mRNA interferase MazF